MSHIYLALSKEQRHYIECAEKCERMKIDSSDFRKLAGEMEELKKLIDREYRISVAAL